MIVDIKKKIMLSCTKQLLALAFSFRNRSSLSWQQIAATHAQTWPASFPKTKKGDVIPHIVYFFINFFLFKSGI